MQENKNFKLTKSDYYDSNNIYLPKIKYFRRGDILLTRKRESEKLHHNLISTAISLATKGNFSHALIMSIRPVLVEAIEDGVSNISLTRCLIHSLENTKALRYHDGNIAAKAASIAMKHIGKEYSKINAIASISKIPGEFLNKGTFCSHLVALCYREAGALEFQNIDISKITPASIEGMECFTDVTNTLFHRVKSPKNAERLTVLDGDRPHSQMDGQAKEYRKIYTETENYLDHFLEVNYSFKKNKPDTFIKLISEMSNYYIFSLSSKNETLIERFKILDTELSKNIRESKLKDMVTESMKEGYDSLDYIKKQSHLKDGDVAIDDVIEMNEFGNEQYIERFESYNSISKYKNYVKSISDYICLQEIVIKACKERIDICEEIINSGRVTQKRI